jgi:hypothetical protein
MYPGTNRKKGPAMLYNQLLQNLPNVVINIHNPAGGQQAFNSANGKFSGNYRVPYGAPAAVAGRSGTGLNVAAGGYAETMNLLSCAFVVYIYAPASLGVVQHVAVFHAHSGDIPNGEEPTAVKYNLHNTAVADIHVVFASSQPDNSSNPKRSIQTAANGLFTILNAGVPQANIRVLTDTGGGFGANSLGEVGTGALPYWSTANLANVLNQTVAAATANYNAQFPPRVTSIGPFGATHNKTEAAGRLQQLTAALNSAQTDSTRIQAMTTFFNGAGSYKAGSLKLMMTQALDTEIRNVAPRLPAMPGGITTLNAQQRSTQVFQQIRAGQI